MRGNIKADRAADHGGLDGKWKMGIEECTGSFHLPFSIYHLSLQDAFFGVLR